MLIDLTGQARFRVSPARYPGYVMVRTSADGKVGLKKSATRAHQLAFLPPTITAEEAVVTRLPTGGVAPTFEDCGVYPDFERGWEYVVTQLHGVASTTERPDFIIVDDIDRAPDLVKCLARLFAILTSFKQKHPQVTIILTANDIKKLDGALRRPGRIDEVVNFKTMPADERKLLLEGYLKEFGAECSDLDKLVEASADLTPAYLREFALQCRYESLESVLDIIRQQKELFVPASGGKKEEAAAPATEAKPS